jgi:hypothetical protein
MERDLVYEDLEGFFPLQNMHVKGVHTDQFGKICLSGLSRTLKNFFTDI